MGRRRCRRKYWKQKISIQRKGLHMKDLKHLIYFENLLQEAQNELVMKAVEDGKKALGYNCYYIPEVLMNLDGCFSSRLRAPNCTSCDISSYYMTNRTCPYARSILERAVEGGYNYLSCLFGAESCATIERMEEHFFLINPVKHDGFFVTQIDPPMKGDKTNLDYYKAQLQLKVVEPMRDRLGIDVSDEAMRKAIERFNELCRVITEIGNYRKLDNPPITGYEFHVIQLVSEVCPHELILPYLKETLEEIKTRKPEKEFPYRARVVVVGSESLRSSSRCAAQWSLPTVTASVPSPAVRRSRSEKARAHLMLSAAIICTGTSVPASWTVRRSISATTKQRDFATNSRLTVSSTRA